MSARAPLLSALALTDEDFFFPPHPICNNFFFLAPFIASLSSFGRCLFPQFLTRLLLLLNLTREKDNFFPFQNGIFFFFFLDLHCLLDLFSAGRDQAVNGCRHSALRQKWIFLAYDQQWSDCLNIFKNNDIM